MNVVDCDTVEFVAAGEYNLRGDGQFSVGTSQSGSSPQFSAYFVSNLVSDLSGTPHPELNLGFEILSLRGDSEFTEILQYWICTSFLDNQQVKQLIRNAISSIYHSFDLSSSSNHVSLLAVVGHWLNHDQILKDCSIHLVVKSKLR